MGTQNYEELEALYINEKNDKEMYKQALFELYQTASYMLLKEDLYDREKVKKQLAEIKEMIGTREGFDD